MEFITGKHMPRRTFLRGVGATVALPMLDAMIPTRLLAGTGRAVDEKTRLVCIEMVHGAAGSSEWGASQNLWAPAEPATPSTWRLLRSVRSKRSRSSDNRQRHRRADGGSIPTQRNRWGSFPIERRVFDTSPSQTDRRI